MKRNFYTFSSFTQLLILSVIIVASFLSSCTNTENSESTEVTEEDTNAFPLDDKRAQKILYSLPSPLEMASIIKKSGTNYNSGILNPIENTTKYVTNTSRAFNLGVYGADLGYTAIYNQTQEAMFYLSSVRKLADGLGVASAFSENTVSRMEENMNNHDSILQIVSDSYLATDEYLKENERASTSAMVLAGGWIEGLYLATKIVKSAKNNKELLQRIAEQKHSLENLVDLLQTYNKDESIKPVLTDLAQLKKTFEAVKETVVAGEVKTDEAKGVTTIGSGVTLEMSTETLEAITTAVANTRNKLVNP